MLEAHLEPRCFTTEELNTSLGRITYPSSHQYSIDPEGRPRPSPKGETRVCDLESVLPSRSWDSLLDVGCAKGMFLFRAWQRYGIRRLVGVEAAPDMVTASRRVAHHLAAPATILSGSLVELHSVLPAVDLVFVLHCYHYLFFGSPDGASGIASHDRLFEILARVTRDTLVFANPLALKEGQRQRLRAAGVRERDIAAYGREPIIAAAERHFAIEETSLGGGRPLIIMRPR
jgi:SAM-dependent methyltransferase